VVPRLPYPLPHAGPGRSAGLILRTALVAVLACALALLAAAPASAVVAPAPPVADAVEPAGSDDVRRGDRVVPVAPIAPIAPVAPGTVTGTDPKPAQLPDNPLELGGKGEGGFNNPLALVLLLGALSLLPAMLIMVTAFTRIVIVLGFVRTALGTQGVPPNQVMIGLALFLTLFVMSPVFSAANTEALQPYLANEISQSQAFERGLEPFRTFMLGQVREQDLQLFVDLSGKPAPATEADMPTSTLIPAFIISELRAAFLIGFVIFIPFVVIDLVVSAVLSAMGMAMLPPSMISLPFKLLLFVAVDGWSLIAQSLVRSFA
jgi:flagellar biosynthetic protein FliP